ncbi:MAG: D-glycerate dehydrogenase [Bacteroidetes bacterium]|nr:D-glycerate dehydrogenase [Bacteroidota bacterium]
MKVFISRDIPAQGIELMRNEGLEVTVWKVDRPMTQPELIENAKQSDALLCVFSDKIDKLFLNECRHLKVIAQLAVGYDNIDIDEATRLRIPIGNTPDVLSEATADAAFLLMLAASRKAFHLHKSIIKGEWTFFRPKANLGIELRNKTLGIFGLGRIGTEMAKRCKGAYQMDVIYCSRSRNSSAEELLQARKVEFDELLSQSDVLSVHCSLNETTNGLFNKEAFHKMKRSAIFINTARGTIHNEKDLIDALSERIIWGAGLDVTNPEPMRPSNPLLSMENVAVLPHVGSATIEARNAMSRLSAENIIHGLRGEKLPNIVNPGIYNR